MLSLGASLRILSREGGLSSIDLLLRDDTRVTLFTEAGRKLTSAIDGEEDTCICELDEGSQRLAVKGDQILLGRVGTPYGIEASRDQLKGMAGLIGCFLIEVPISIGRQRSRCIGTLTYRHHRFDLGAGQAVDDPIVRLLGSVIATHLRLSPKFGCSEE